MFLYLNCQFEFIVKAHVFCLFDIPVQAVFVVEDHNYSVLQVQLQSDIKTVQIAHTLYP